MGENQLRVHKLDELSPRWTRPENRQRLARAEEVLPSVVRAEQEQAMKLADSKTKDGVKLAGLYMSEKVTPTTGIERTS